MDLFPFDLCPISYSVDLENLGEPMAHSLYHVGDKFAHEAMQ